MSFWQSFDRGESPMTQMLASVRSRQEALLAQAAGADIIDMKEPEAGALGALAPEMVAQIRSSLKHPCTTSAVIGDLPMEPAVLRDAAQKMAETGVTYVKIGFFPSPRTQECIAALASLAQQCKWIAVLFADLQPDFEILSAFADAGFAGVMLDTATKGAGRLLTHLDVSNLSDFVGRAQSLGLVCGLAGGLEPPDVPRLLLARPDYLGFRGALCAGARNGAIDRDALNVIRALIPQATQSTATSKVDWRLLAARGYSREGTIAEGATDCVFVRDYVVSAHIGAYNFEHGIAQKVRFNVEVDVTRLPLGADDMRDVFSYDIIIDAIALILKQGHIAMVETLVEQLAQTLLQHRRVVKANVRAEKLDIINGSVGVSIERRRVNNHAAVHGLFPKSEDISS